MSTKFQLISKFKGYRNKEDQTNLDPGTMVKGSRNVLTNHGERIAVRKGFTLDGSANATMYGITSSYEWQTHLGTERALRSYYDKLQFRYVETDGTVNYYDLMTGLTTNVDFNFAEWWDATEISDLLLFVNGSTNIYSWSGAVTTFASATVNTITKQGVTTWNEEGFLASTTGRTVVIDGVTYAYTGGHNTTTLTGVTPDPTAVAHAVGAVVFQGVITTANSAMTDIPAAFTNDLISTVYNNVFVGSFDYRDVYMSKQSDYKIFTYSAARLAGEGALFTLDSTPVAFAPQEEAMYISAGKSDWYQITFTKVSDATANKTTETINVLKLKSGFQQGAKSQAMVCNNKNSVVFVSNEPVITELGRVQLITTPQNTDLSDPIKGDMINYDFTGASMTYFQNFLYVTLPAEGLFIMYNFAKGWWEAPQTGQFSRFAIINDEIYGHSSVTPETFKLFYGVNDNGAPIDAIARFAYNNFGDRADNKNFNEFYIEGYIAANTTITFNANYDYQGNEGNFSDTINGAQDSKYIVGSTGAGSLGKQPLGKRSFAGRGETIDETLPPKFRIILTMPKTTFYEYQPEFTSNQDDANWELIAFGPGALLATAGNNNIKR